MRRKLKGLKKKFERGFTLTEMLVVLIIIGVLVLLAVPRFTAVVKRAKMTEAKLMLKQVYTLEEAYFTEFDKYSKNLGEIGFEQERLVTEGGEARYRIMIESATDTSFVAKAISVVDYDKDGQFNVWRIDHRKRLVEELPD
ncbi:MAG: prepilin-type N-terminal cleavage/methylation domain-containing protein [Candidatus Marinimicrobia bacterium]|nr:prepilin-type N-terminal cleavage/methylation domain-containing protein [Candidatus Neomarinimicrobiota bacterium]